MILGRCGHTGFEAAAVSLLQWCLINYRRQTRNKRKNACDPLRAMPSSNTVKPQRQLRAAKDHCSGFCVPDVAIGHV